MSEVDRKWYEKVKEYGRFPCNPVLYYADKSMSPSPTATVNSVVSSKSTSSSSSTIPSSSTSPTFSISTASSSSSAEAATAAVAAATATVLAAAVEAVEVAHSKMASTFVHVGHAADIGNDQIIECIHNLPENAFHLNHGKYFCSVVKPGQCVWKAEHEAKQQMEPDIKHKSGRPKHRPPGPMKRQKIDNNNNINNDNDSEDHKEQISSLTNRPTRNKRSNL